MRNLKIKNKIIVLMSLLLLIITGNNIFSLTETSRINDQSTNIARNWLPSVEAITLLNWHIARFRLAEYAMVTALDEAKRQSFYKLRDEREAAVMEARKTYEALMTEPEEKQLYQEYSGDWINYMATSNKIKSYLDNGMHDQAVTLLQTESRDAYEEFSDDLIQIMNINSNGGKKASDHADNLYKKVLITSLSISAALLAFSILVIFLLVRGIASPIVSITRYMEYLSDGKLDRDVPSQDQKDEVGDMARSVQVFKDNMVRTRELESTQEKERQAKEARQQNVNTAIEKFELSMSDIVKFVAAASVELQASAQSLAASAEETSKQSGAVSASSHQAAANVQTVASATEELSSSINEISSQVSRSSQVANKAVHDAEDAGNSVSELVAAAQKIGDVTKIISDIAEQTNLLALNATIEAARAGDAGKGFAVVAAEVKNLANESAKATEEISQQIQSIQKISQTSAEAIGEICKIIREMDEISASISSAIQQQTSATQEISRNVSEAYVGTSEVTQNIGTVSEAANTTGAASHQVLSAADELSRQSDIMKKEFDDFLRALAAA